MKRAFLGLCVLTLGACSFKMQASSGGASSPSSASEPKKTRPHRSGGKTKHWSASFHESGSLHVNWQGRSGTVCRTVSPFKFAGTAKLSGTAHYENGKLTSSGSASASGTSSGGVSKAGSCETPRVPVPERAPAKPVTHPPKPEPEKPTRTKPKPGDIGKAPTTNPNPVKTTPTVPVGPTPEELEKPVDPPKEPPDNVFGYEKPVLGCFEGQVFTLEENAAALPKSYDALKPVSVLYACEWDIPPRSWDQGFPGVLERFEWFAIRYAGAFRIADAGKYTFRLSSDDGSKLVVDGKVVIDNDQQHPPQAKSGEVELAAGDHQMVLEYFQGPRFEINLQLWVTPPAAHGAANETGKSEELFTVR